MWVTHSQNNTQYLHVQLRRKQLKSTLVSSSDCLGCILHIDMFIILFGVHRLVPTLSVYGDTKLILDQSD